MDLSPVLREVGECLSALLPGGSPSVCMYTTNDDAELDRVGRDVYCFFSSGILAAHLPEEFTLPAVSGSVRLWRTRFRVRASFFTLLQPAITSHGPDRTQHLHFGFTLRGRCRAKASDTDSN